MAKKPEKVEKPEPVAPAPARLVAGPDEVIVTVGDPNWQPLREVVIKKAQLGVTIVLDRQSYHHVATAPDGRWIFVPV